MTKLFTELGKIRGLGRFGRALPNTRCERGSLLALHFVVQALAHDAPIAEILGDRPDEVERSAAEAPHVVVGRGEEFLGAPPGFLWKNDEKLLPAARSKEHLRESELRDDGARQNFTEQTEPLRAAGEIELVSRTCEQKRLGAEDSAL